MVGATSSQVATRQINALEMLEGVQWESNEEFAFMIRPLVSLLPVMLPVVSQRKHRTTDPRGEDDVGFSRRRNAAASAGT
jgi:hypothetical protein